MTRTKKLAIFAGALALAFAIAATPALFSQQDERPMGEQHQHGHGHGQMGEMPEGHAEMMEAHKEKMAEHKEAMEAHMAKMEELVAEMNRVEGDAKTDAVAAVINEMWSHHQSMREAMGGMGMMGGMGCMGMMGGHGMAAGGGEGHACKMHGAGGCRHHQEAPGDATGAAGSH